MSDFLEAVDLENQKFPRNGSEPGRLRRLLEKFNRNRQCVEKHE